jgi:hypothetical protein
LGVHRDNGDLRVEILDSKTLQFIRAVYFNNAFAPQDLVTIADINGNGTVELALLGRRISDGLLRIMIYDAGTAQRLQSINIF